MYVTYFNKEALRIDEADDKVLVTAFTSGLKRGKFLFSIYKNDPKTMAKALYKATNYMNAEDEMKARGDGPRKRERQDDPHPDLGRKSARTNDRRDDERSRPSLGRTKNFTPLNASLDQVLMPIRDNTALTWLDKLKGDLNKRPKNSITTSTRTMGMIPPNATTSSSRSKPSLYKGSCSGSLKIGKTHRGTPSPTYGPMRDPEPHLER